MRSAFVISATAALVAVTSSAATVDIPSVSDTCKNYMIGLVGDEKLNQCLPIASLVTMISTTAAGKWDNSKLSPLFKQFCSVKPCQQSTIDAYAANITTQCATDLQALNNPARIVSAIFKMYTPLQASACYLDTDKDYCLSKSIQSLNLDLNVGVSDVTMMFSNATTTGLCTKGNQHVVGTFVDYISKNPSTTFPITADQKDKIVSIVSQKCGDAFGKDLLTATGPPYPDIQKQYGGAAAASSSNAGAIVPSSSAFALAVFLAIGIWKI